MIDRVKAEHDAMALLSGEHERIITFTLGGADYSLDALDVEMVVTVGDVQTVTTTRSTYSATVVRGNRAAPGAAAGI